MIDELISIKTMKLAEKKGFNNYMYLLDKWVKFNSKPTQSLLQKWMREKHSISVLIYDCLDFAYGYEIGTVHVNDMRQDDNSFDTYEKALEAGLYKALKLIHVL